MKKSIERLGLGTCIAKVVWGIAYMGVGWKGKAGISFTWYIRRHTEYGIS